MVVEGERGGRGDVEKGGGGDGEGRGGVGGSGERGGVGGEGMEQEGFGRGQRCEWGNFPPPSQGKRELMGVILGEEGACRSRLIQYPRPRQEGEEEKEARVRRQN